MTSATPEMDRLDIPELTREQLGNGVRGKYHEQFRIVIEPGSQSFGAYVPDLPGCVAVAETREEVTRLIDEGIELHLADLKQDDPA